MQIPIRISHLKSPFVYRTMQDIETARPQKRTVELPHRHDFFTIILVEKSGIGTHQIDFKTYDLTPNTLYFIAPEQIHSLEFAPNTDSSRDYREGVVRGHVLMFTDDFLLEHSLAPEHLNSLGLFFNCDETKPLILNEADVAGLQFFFQKIDLEFQADKQDRWAALGAWLKLFLLECRRLKSDKQLTVNKLDNRKSEIVRQFKNDIEQHFKTWHQVNDYAQAQNLTSNYLNEIIKAETGTSAKDFIQNRLLLEAKRLAHYSTLTAKEIAYAIGYEDVAHFSKFFKKGEGVSFSDFKNRPIL